MDECKGKKLSKREAEKKIKKTSRMITLDLVMDILTKDKKNSFDKLGDELDKKRTKAKKTAIKISKKATK
jgi:hypothetical protein